MCYMDRIQTNTPYERRFSREARVRSSPLAIHRRDMEVFRHLYHTRMLSSQLLAVLVKTPGTQDESLVRRLQKLFWAGYVDRPARQAHHTRDPFSGKYTGLRPLAYSLGQRGAQVIAEELGDHTIGRLNWLRKNKELTGESIEHALLTGHVYACVQLALRVAQTRGTAAELTYWREGQEDLMDVFFVDREGKHIPRPRPEDKTERHVVYPDAMFSIAGPGKAPGERVAHNCVLESDRGTMTTQRFCSKLRAFWLWQRLGLHTEAFSVKRFLVLTVTLTTGRRDSLRKIAREADDRKTGSKLFRFAALEDLPLDKPWRVFDRVWYTPVDDEPTSILS